jgi:hypothetical protein
MLSRAKRDFSSVSWSSDSPTDLDGFNQHRPVWRLEVHLASEKTVICRRLPISSLSTSSP